MFVLEQIERIANCIHGSELLMLVNEIDFPNGDTCMYAHTHTQNVCNKFTHNYVFT